MNSPSPITGLEPPIYCITMPKTAKKNSLSSNRSAPYATRSKKTTGAVPVAELAPKELRVQQRNLLPSKGAELRVAGCDFCTSLSSATSVTIASQVIRLLNSTLFPRLQYQGYAFTRYRFLKLSFSLVGRSASTQKGNAALAAVITDGMGGTVNVATEADVKNLDAVVVARGWQTSTHRVPVEESGLKWLATDTDAGTDLIGSSLGTLFYFISATASAADLVYDLFVEYDAEFAGMSGASALNLDLVRAIQKAVKGKKVVSGGDSLTEGSPAELPTSCPSSSSHHERSESLIERLRGLLTELEKAAV